MCLLLGSFGFDGAGRWGAGGWRGGAGGGSPYCERQILSSRKLTLPLFHFKNYLSYLYFSNSIAVLTKI